MRIDGRWHATETGVRLPCLDLEVRGANGARVPATFLLDTGAERTTFTYDLVDALQLEPEPDDGTYLAGVGGTSPAIRLATALLLPIGGGRSVPMNGVFYGFADPIALDMSLLGRDVLSNFAVIVDRPGNQIMLLARDHRYQIVSS